MHLWAKSHDQLQGKAHTLYDQHLIQQGQEVETLVKDYIEAFLLPTYETAQLFWQPTYDDGQFQVRADALIWDGSQGAYDLYEIKSSTSVHREHEYDLTFQALLLENILNLGRIYLIHIDKNYQQGEMLDLENFFSVEPVTEKVEKRRKHVELLRQEALAVTQTQNPDPTFACTNPKRCPCTGLCHPNLPNNPIYDIPYIGKKAVQLREMGITDIHSIPSAFKLNEKQEKHVQAVKTGKPVIDAEAVEESLSALEYPHYFLDYETFNPAIPLFPNYHPYEHIVFQYSLHVVNQPGDEAEHFDCLITDKRDPASAIIPNLMNHLGPKGSVVVWNRSFESQRNQDLASHCPSYKPQLESINDRLYDLMLIFRNGFYVHPNFHGSASLKAVLPALCPELRYESLAISNGEEAMMTWYWLQTGSLSEEDLEQTSAALREYCQLDTYAMVAILDKLRKIVRRTL